MTSASRTASSTLLVARTPNREMSVGMSVGGTHNAYTNADFRSDLSGALPLPAPTDKCPAMGTLGTSAPVDCKYIFVRDNVPQGLGAVMLAASEMEF